MRVQFTKTNHSNNTSEVLRTKDVSSLRSGLDFLRLVADMNFGQGEWQMVSVEQVGTLATWQAVRGDETVLMQWE